ncbi:hypothetical protein [Solimicrobium silvestre]|uniref:Uncharacterized protein n=1 Tax=Solimicrobium silvestre TaxID=2099400 RepID=A0A2S9GYD2_9BURK|nr:hypothetical protein [Solimicrobium silvestre]PRC92729.1 hypothetical protein S2091_2459 [Solimicrobium silvestre]
MVLSIGEGGMVIDESENILDDFSQAFADRLFSLFPEWRMLQKIERASDGSNYLSLEIAAPAEANAVCGLTVTTENNEVTIGFDYYHGHFFDQVGNGTYLGADYALYFLSQILNEEIFFTSWWIGDQLLAFSTIENGKVLMDDALVGEYGRVRIRSWNGSRNSDINATV